MPAPIVRRAAVSDDAAIMKLLGELLPSFDVPARFEWLYRRNPAGAGVVWLAFDSTTSAPTGMTAFVPRALVAGGASVRGALGADSWVGKRHRRRGIATSLFDAARADMDRDGFEVMFGTPMDANTTPLRASGSRLDARVVRMVRPLDGRAFRLPQPLADLLPRFASSARGTRLDEVRGHDPRIDRIWEEARHELDVGTVRDAAFYDWRFVQSPSKVQRPFVILERGVPMAACALESAGDALHIVDLVAPRRHWGKALRAIAAHALGHERVEIRLAADDAASRHLWRHGFFARGEAAMSTLVSPSSKRAAHLGDPARWFYTRADADMDCA